MAAPLVDRRRGPAPPSRLPAVGARRCSALLGVLLVLVIGVFGAIFGLQPAQIGYGPSAIARAEIPRAYLRLYVDAGAALRRSTRGSSPRIGAIETDHGRSTRAGRALRRQHVRLLRRPDAVLDRRLPEHLGPLRRRRQPRRPHAPPTTPRTRSPPPPATCAPAAPRGDYRAALFAYNHADWYVADGPRQGRRLPRRARGGRAAAAARPATSARCCATRGSCSPRCSAPTCTAG